MYNKYNYNSRHSIDCEMNNNRNTIKSSSLELESRFVGYLKATVWSFRNIRFMDISNILIFRIKTIWFIRFRYSDFRLYFMKFFDTPHPFMINIVNCIVYWELGVNNGSNCILILQAHHDISVANISLSYQLTYFTIGF